MFSSLLVLNKDASCRLLMKTMGADVQAVDNLVEILKVRLEGESSEERQVLTLENSGCCGIFIAINDVIILGVTAREVRPGIMR